MNRNKRQRDVPIDDNEKKKFVGTSSSLLPVDRTLKPHFEDLSNELIYEIFDYLDPYHVYQIFFDLNKRFRNLCLHPIFPMKIDQLSISKSKFQCYYNDFLLSVKHRIYSIKLSNPFLLDFFSSSKESISNCTSLQTLILERIHTECLENLLKNLATLPVLSSLAVVITQNSNRTTIYQLIFQLPVLKSCKLSFEDNFLRTLLPIATNPTSPIEHLTINGNKFNPYRLDNLLSYVPKLCHLSINYLNGYSGYGTIALVTVLKHLTHVSLVLNQVEFLDFELLIKQYYNQIQILQISSNYDLMYLNASRWERLIVSFMPCLHTFDFQYIYRLSSSDTHEYMYQRYFQSFASLFWLKRQWFFAYDHNSGGNSFGIFYSVQPYRRKSFTITGQSSLSTDASNRTIHLSSVNHVLIPDEKLLSDCSKYFPNATELTISDQRIDRTRRFVSDTIDKILPLNQLTKLVIDYSHRPFSKVIDLLYETPNVHTIVFKRLSLVSTDYLPRQQSKKYHLVRNENRIKNLVISFDYSLQDIQLLVQLCSKLEDISIGVSEYYLEPTLQFLLKKVKTSSAHLSLICISGDLNQKLSSLIKSNNCSIKTIEKIAFIWW